MLSFLSHTKQTKCLNYERIWFIIYIERPFLISIDRLTLNLIFA